VISDSEGDAAVIADLAARLGSREVLDLVDGAVAGVVLEQGQQLVQIGLEEYEATPARKTGSVALASADSFSVYVNRHSDSSRSTLWADVDAGVVIAVLDDHAVSEDLSVGAGWGEHRATLTLAETPDWAHWLANDGEMVTQSEFAEHIEFGASSVKDPSAADMLEIAQTFHAKSGVDFKSGIRLATGETQLQYEENTAARAGVAGSIEIPESFTISLQPFYSSQVYEVLARFRYRINSGHLKLGYRLVRPDLARQQAFDDLCADIGAATTLDVLAGTPRTTS
jgi:uncharacterized protein YfdQ (DUF2303 family)